MSILIRLQMPPTPYALMRWLCREKLVGLQQRETTAQGTTVWGEPASVILKCGVTVQEPVSDPCAEVNGRLGAASQDAPENSAPPVSASSSAAAGPENRATGTWTATTYRTNARH